MLAPRRHPSPPRRRCSRWPTSGVGPRSRTNFIAPRGSGPRSPRNGPRHAGDDRMSAGAIPSQVRGPGLALRWTTLSYLGVMVVLPMIALGAQAARPGLGPFWEALSDPYAWHALKLTFLTALIMV